MKPQTEQTFRTCSLSVIALLLASGLHPEKTERTGAKRVFFYFPNLKKCQELEQKFYGNCAMVSAKAYVEAMEEAKDIIFSKAS